MDERTFIGGERRQPQVLFIDGHKVTVRYSEQENPTAIKTIKNTLISCISAKKS